MKHESTFYGYKRDKILKFTQNRTSMFKKPKDIRRKYIFKVNDGT